MKIKSNIHKTERVNLMASKILCGNCLKNLKQRIKQDFVDRIKVKLDNQGMKKDFFSKKNGTPYVFWTESENIIELGVDMWNFVCFKMLYLCC